MEKDDFKNSAHIDKYASKKDILQRGVGLQLSKVRRFLMKLRNTLQRLKNTKNLKIKCLLLPPFLFNSLFSPLFFYNQLQISLFFFTLTFIFSFSFVIITPIERRLYWIFCVHDMHTKKPLIQTRLPRRKSYLHELYQSIRRKWRHFYHRSKHQKKDYQVPRILRINSIDFDSANLWNFLSWRKSFKKLVEDQRESPYFLWPN